MRNGPRWYHDCLGASSNLMEQDTKIWFVNGVDNVNWPPYRDWKADVSSVSPSSEQIALVLKANLLWWRANARNVSFSISVRWSIYIINSVDKPNFRVLPPHWRSTTVSLKTKPLYSYGAGLPLWEKVRGKQFFLFFQGWSQSGKQGLRLMVASWPKYSKI